MANASKFNVNKNIKRKKTKTKTNTKRVNKKKDITISKWESACSNHLWIFEIL